MFRRKAGFSQHFGKAASLWAEACGRGVGPWLELGVGRAGPRRVLLGGLSAVCTSGDGVCVCGGNILPLQPLTSEENCANLKRIHQLNNKIK